jgi:uncharacterized protein (DUF2384 family)
LDVKSESTLRRANKGKSTLGKEPSARIYEIGRVIDQAAKTFRGDEAVVARFFNSPNPVLEGRTPFEVAKSSSAGAEAVARSQCGRGCVTGRVLAKALSAYRIGAG